MILSSPPSVLLGHSLELARAWAAGGRVGGSLSCAALSNLLPHLSASPAADAPALAPSPAQAACSPAAAPPAAAAPAQILSLELAGASREVVACAVWFVSRSPCCYAGWEARRPLLAPGSARLGSAAAAPGALAFVAGWRGGGDPGWQVDVRLGSCDAALGASVSWPAAHGTVAATLDRATGSLGLRLSWAASPDARAAAGSQHVEN